MHGHQNLKSKYIYNLFLLEKSNDFVITKSRLLIISWSLTLREEGRLRVLENREVRGIFWTKGTR